MSEDLRGCLSLPPPLADDFFYTDRVYVLASESNVSMHSRHADRHNGKYLYDLYIVFTRPVFGSVHFYGLLKEPIINPLKFNMANGRHIDNNLAITNRSRVSCAHNTLRASISLNITP